MTEFISMIKGKEAGEEDGFNFQTKVRKEDRSIKTEKATHVDNIVNFETADWRCSGFEFDFQSS